MGCVSTIPLVYTRESMLQSSQPNQLLQISKHLFFFAENFSAFLRMCVCVCVIKYTLMKKKNSIYTNFTQDNPPSLLVNLIQDIIAVSQKSVSVIF